MIPPVTLSFATTNLETKVHDLKLTLILEAA